MNWRNNLTRYGGLSSACTVVVSLAMGVNPQSMVSAEAAADIGADLRSSAIFPNAIFSDGTPLNETSDVTSANATPTEALCIPQLQREALAQLPLTDLVQLSLFLPTNQGELVTTESQLSATNLSQPSLFWIQDQLSRRYDLNNLVAQWQAYRTPIGLNYVDVVVNEGDWQQLGYFRRYAFVSQFGTAAQKDGYHLRVFHTGDASNCRDARAAEGLQTPRVVVLRGAYLCGLRQADSPSLVSCRTYILQ